MPITSMLPLSVTSPTIATTFEVPMSSPTIRFLSPRLDIQFISLAANSFSFSIAEPLAGMLLPAFQPMLKPLL